MADIILHHYPPSPVSEKIRTAFGLKKVRWHSVEQNRLPDRPELLAMTGGYRRIPVMQIGADIYCDTQLILRELERRIPSPSLHPGGTSGMAFGLSRWIDDELFKLGVRLAFAPAVDSLPEALVTDRTRLYFGPDGDMAAEAADLPHTLAQFRAQLGWLNDQLRDQRQFLTGDAPAMEDLLGWYLLWFFTGRYADAGDVLAEFPELLAWAANMRAIGHGSADTMTAQQALAIALEATPRTAEATDPNDPQALAPGMAVSISPLTNSGETAVSGTIVATHRDAIAIARQHALCGDVVVHFPRVGYRVTS